MINTTCCDIGANKAGKAKKALCYVALIATIAICSVGSLARADIISSVNTGVLIEQLRRTANELIDHSERTGDFLAWRVAIQARDALDALERKIENTSKITFERITTQQQDVFRNIDRTLADLKLEKELTVRQVQDLTAQWAQIISNTILASDDPYILNYSPRVVLPSGINSVFTKIIGPNIGEADGELLLHDKSLVKLNSSSHHEAHAEIPRTVFIPKENEAAIEKVTLTYTDKLTSIWSPGTWFSASKANKDMVFWVAPIYVGSYAITTKVRRNDRETTTKVLDLGGFKGRNTEQNRAVPIPEYEHGWRLDLTRKNEIKLNQISADNGRCEGIRWPSVTENGLTMYVRLDQTKQMFPRDASVHCTINLPVYRIAPMDVDGPSKSGRISWTSDEEFELPSGILSKRIEVNLFNGRTYVFTGAGKTPYTNITEEGGRLIIRPDAPLDF
jgi:hypothetical protein